jgi:hypothetical protein
MSLGNNRDYKTNDHRVRTNLAKHLESMTRLVAEGMNEEAASKETLKQVLHPEKKTTKAASRVAA